MQRNISKTLTILAAASAIAGSLAYMPVAEAFNFGDMMNPGKWMGGKNRDRYDDYYDGPYGGPGYGYGGPGYGFGGPGYGFGGPGYGGPGYGYGGYGAPGYGAPAVAPPAPAAPAAAATPAAPARSSSASEIEALKRRIDELESSQRPSTPAPATSNDWPSAPAFRPMSKY